MQFFRGWCKVKATFEVPAALTRNDLGKIPMKYEKDYLGHRWDMPFSEEIHIGDKTFTISKIECNDFKRRTTGTFRANVHYKLVGENVGRETLVMKIAVDLAPHREPIPDVYYTGFEGEKHKKFLWFEMLLKDSSVSCGVSKLKGSKYSSAAIYVGTIQDYKLIFIYSCRSSGATRDALDAFAKKLWHPLTMSWANKSLHAKCFVDEIKKSWVPKRIAKNLTVNYSLPVMKQSDELIDKAKRYADATLAAKVFEIPVPRGHSDFV